MLLEMAAGIRKTNCLVQEKSDRQEKNLF